MQVMLDNHGDMVGSAGCGNGVRSDIFVSINCIVVSNDLDVFLV
jgi:hypothetical protein